MTQEKFIAFNEFSVKYIKSRAIESEPIPLKRELTILINDLIQEIEYNKHDYQEPSRFSTYKNERLDFILGSLIAINEIIRPKELELRLDLNLRKNNPNHKSLLIKPRYLGKHHVRKLFFLSLNMSDIEARKQINEEVEFIDEQIKFIESLKDAESGNQKNDSPMKIETMPPLVKIKWDGQRNQLYDVIRQLKDGENKILNSYPEIAVFLKANFDIFQNTSLQTIQTELQRGKRPPKSRRINIDKSGQGNKENTTGNITGELSKL